ncbi:MAG: response regulator [Candidatus Desantisbacteria bacterium]
MDIRLPGINGVETFIQIKEIDSNIKVVMMTGFSVEDLMEQAIREGAYACIHKPFDVQKVIKLIEQIIDENKKIILIVNGDGKTREDIKNALTEKGYHICIAKDGEEAVAKLKNKHYNCILLNLSLPGTNGLSILKQAKELYPDVVVIVMSDCELPEMVSEAKYLSAYAYIKKPIDIEELVRLLKGANL